MNVDFAIAQFFMSQYFFVAKTSDFERKKNVQKCSCCFIVLIKYYLQQTSAKNDREIVSSDRVCEIAIKYNSYGLQSRNSTLYLCHYGR
jgi:hypothetical protein